MAHDPRREDYRRMALRFALTLDDDPAAARTMAGFGRRLARERDTLPQTDADRAFHLVTLAAELIDWRLPFAADDQVGPLESRARGLLDEALSLDPACHDAARMRLFLQTSSADERCRELSGREDEVRASCEAASERARAELGGERGGIAAGLAIAPWWRWLASLAREALVCGRYRQSVDACERLVSADPHDTSDARFTLAYALAKLEDESGLAELGRRYGSLAAPRAADDAWLTLARVALAHKSFDLASAREQVARLLSAYPDLGFVLVRQVEVSDGSFARLCAAPYSEDELTLAVSEGVVLTQEGRERTGRGVLGAWLASTVAEMDPEAGRRAADEEMRGARRP